MLVFCAKRFRCAIALQGNWDVHLSVDVDGLLLLGVVGADLEARVVDGVEFADVEVLLRLRPDLIRLILRLLADEGDHLLDLLLHLRVVHDGRVGGSAQGSQGTDAWRGRNKMENCIALEGQAGEHVAHNSRAVKVTVASV